jgi:hypothetical protein
MIIVLASAIAALAGMGLAHLGHKIEAASLDKNSSDQWEAFKAAMSGNRS